jgi:DUF1707 SHOCT-like domain
MRYRWDPIYPEYRRRTSPSDADIRASDAERTEVADRLSHHFADGRLDQTEFKARLDRAMGATTRGDLGGLFDDLPSLPDETPPPRRRHLLRAVVFVVLVAAVVGSTFSVAHVAWVPAVLLALLLWRVLGGHHRRYVSVSQEHYDRGGPRP